MKEPRLKVRWREDGATEIVLEGKTDSDGTLQIKTEGGQWDVVGFKIVNGKLHLIRYGSIVDPRVAVDSDGKIKEVDE